ncbi:hypothetical protein [Streptosporangium carneum]|uniref:hypothetical protein n=1 Tax=Streptosporangium carneum TaxID=47481 RepID=UPI0022F31687|nr:hypothetical protein [Streptosporangium carneum]
MLTDGVVPPHPAQAVFDAMLTGWERQQAAGGLDDQNESGPGAPVRRVHRFFSMAVDAR